MKKQSICLDSFDPVKIESIKSLGMITGGETYRQTCTDTVEGKTTKDWQRESDNKQVYNASDSVHPGDIGTGWQ